MAGRDVKLGTILTARLIDPTILVKSGQLVSITLTQGAISAKSVARATEQGTIGQTIRVKNEVTNNLFDVVVTGPQTAKLPAQQPSATDVAALDR
jgi:flagella basal body P-ring formation protein FlgA